MNISAETALGDNLAMSRQMLMLSFISYVGTEFTGPTMDYDLLQRINSTMQASPTVQGRWNIVWGPATYVPSAEVNQEHGLPPDATPVAAHVLFCVQSTDDPTLYAVVIRGTNSGAQLDTWEDTTGFSEQVGWPYRRPGSGLNPMFSQGYSFGLDCLRSARPDNSVPGSGLAIRDFLNSIVTGSAGTQIITTGQSLGGGLAPVLALWLQNTQGSEWDSDRNARISTCPFASPSPGNTDFAMWYDQSLGATTHRVWQSLDMPPYKWNAEQMTQILGLYGDGMSGMPKATALIEWERSLVKGMDYLQIRNDQSAITGQLNPKITDWLSQMSYQHVYGYLDVLGLQEETDLVLWIFGPGKKP